MKQNFDQAFGWFRKSIEMTPKNESDRHIYVFLMIANHWFNETVKDHPDNVDPLIRASLGEKIIEFTRLGAEHGDRQCQDLLAESLAGRKHHRADLREAYKW